MSLNNEQRQHINLSRYAYNIISEDAFTFFWNDNITGIINKILLNSWQTSEASIELAANVKKESLTQQFSKRYDNAIISDYDTTIIEYLTQEYIDGLLERIKKYPKEIAKKIRLNNEVNSIFYPEGNTPLNPYYRTQGDYIKAILEEYSLKSYAEREAILFKDTIEKLEYSIDANNPRILLITFKSLRGNTHKIYFKPYRFSAPSEDNYLYITGLSRFVDSPSSEYKKISYRISRILDISICSKKMGSGRLTDKEKKGIEKAIATNGIEFLVNDAEEIKVKLSDTGKRIFNTLSHLRPHVEDIEELENGSSIYSFFCTTFQAKNYFSSFGKDAIIIEPKSLTQKMNELFSDANNAYNEITNS